MRFESREQAAHLLAQKLAEYKARNPLVLGVPRGAVPMAKIIAETLNGELDVVLVHKLRVPSQPELAFGSVDEEGNVYAADFAPDWGISAEYIMAEKQAQLESLRKRRALYTPLRAPVDPAGRIVIVVDDGLATGATMIAALRAIRAKNPKKLIAAMAVAPPETLEKIAESADEVVCLQAPEFFYAVGEFFEDFSQVSDEEVIAILRQSESEPIAQKTDTG